jgi:hypothetical protein
MLQRSIIILFFIHLSPAKAQSVLRGDTVVPKSVYSIGIGLHYGFVFAHSKEVQNTKGAKPIAMELDLNKQLIQNESWNECRCFPRTGLLISYFDLDNEVLGKSFNAAWYIEPFFSTTRIFKISLKGAAGLSYATNPHDAATNPDNNSYSMYLNAYLGLGLGGNFSLSRHINAKVSAYYNHISNGGLKDPNKGINWPAITLQVFYVYNPYTPSKENKSNIDYSQRLLRKDVNFYLTQKNIYAIWGGGISFSRQFAGMNAWTFGGEFTVDHALENKMEEDHATERDFVLGGLLAGHEFLMGCFNFSQQLGIYIFKAEDYFKPIYQRYGLTYALTKSISMGVNLKAHGKEASFLDGRIVYSWK